MIKIATIIGARPQFIKAAVVSRFIRENHKNDIEEIIVHTGQHYDTNMSDIFFSQMDIPKPDYKLNVNKLTHGAMTGKMLEKTEEILIKIKPDLVLVYGDTNTTLAGALAAKKIHIKLAHVEAGLRSFNIKMPEEINRILTDRISDFLFCPTDHAVKNLDNEGFKNFGVKLVKSGDVMQDAAIHYSERAIEPGIGIKDNFILTTIHRAENTDDKQKLQSIFSALSEIAKDCPVVLPLHPRTKKIIDNYNINYNDNDILIIDPVGYLEMIYLLKNCRVVMTDSGGLQKEAFFFKKMCLTLREETEWKELVEIGANSVVGSDKNTIITAYNNIKSEKVDFHKDLYGNGRAGEVIINTLLTEMK